MGWGSQTQTAARRLGLELSRAAFKRAVAGAGAGRPGSPLADLVTAWRVAGRPFVCSVASRAGVGRDRRVLSRIDSLAAARGSNGPGGRPARTRSLPTLRVRARALPVYTKGRDTVQVEQFAAHAVAVQNMGHRIGGANRRLCRRPSCVVCGFRFSNFNLLKESHR